MSGLFLEFVVLLVAIVPFIIVWHVPASLLTKSLAPVIFLLFFTMALMGILYGVGRGYAERFVVGSFRAIGQTLAEESLPPEDVIAVIRQWQIKGELSPERINTMLQKRINERKAAVLEEPPAESSGQTEPSEQPAAAAPAEPPASE